MAEKMTEIPLLLDLLQDWQGENEAVTEMYKHCAGGDYAEVLNASIVSDLISRCSDTSDDLKHYVENNFKERDTELLIVGISALQTFVQLNWTGPALELSLPPIIPSALTANGEHIYSNTSCPQLLWLAKIILVENLDLLTIRFPTARWWALRALSIHQALLNELSQILCETSCKIIEIGIDFESLSLTDQDACTFKVRYLVEVAQIYLTYFKTSLALENINKAKEIAGIEISLTGAMGKRTKYQQNDIAQLIVKVDRTLLGKEPESPPHLPKNVLLNDEVYLEKAELTEKVEVTQLSAAEQAIVMVSLRYAKCTRPVDELATEEILSYVRCLLDQPRDWSMFVSALTVRSGFETKTMRTLDRCMSQLQELVEQFPKAEPSNLCRLKMFYCSDLPPKWELEKRLGSALIQLGCVKNALEIFIRLELWDEVIACYHCLERRHKAEEIVREQMKTREDPILYCQLGDCTDDPEHYLKAWSMSNKRCTRAQRSLGHLYFRQKKYKECVEPYQECLLLNSLQPEVSRKLGFAAMTTEQWEISAKAYRNAVNIEPDNYEVWNNLSNVYIQMKKKNQAWRTLQEALKCNFHNWRIWENYMIVSIDCGAFNEAMTAFHRILDEQEKYVDEPVLKVLCKAVIEGIKDNTGQPADKLRDRAVKLFGRITSKIVSNALVWKLYADLYEMEENPSPEVKGKILQFRQKAQRIMQQKSGWENSAEETKAVLEYSIELAQASLKYTVDAKARIPAKMSINSVLSLIRLYQEKTGVEHSEECSSLKDNLTQLCTEMTK